MFEIQQHCFGTMTGPGPRLISPDRPALTRFNNFYSFSFLFLWKKIDFLQIKFFLKDLRAGPSSPTQQTDSLWAADRPEKTDPWKSSGFEGSKFSYRIRKNFN